jgi:hypothetical protein
VLFCPFHNLEVTVSIPPFYTEESVFLNCITTIISAVKGQPLLRITDETLIDPTTEHSIVVNATRMQCDWLERHFNGWTDMRACNYMLAKLQRSAKERPIPFEAGDARAELAIVVEGIAQGTATATKMAQLDIKRVTCFMDGERRRFVAHLNAILVEL